MKKTGAVLLAIIILICAASFSSLSYTYGKLTYELTDGKAIITSCAADSESVTVPSQINGADVTGIANYAFDGCYALEELVLPQTLTAIGVGAFRGCVSLSDVTIPDSVAEIGTFAFDDANGVRLCCKSGSAAHTYALTYGVQFLLTDAQGVDALFEYTVGSLYVTIDKYIGAASAVVIPDKIGTLPVGGIAAEAFANNRTVSAVTIPASVEKIGRGAFSGCINMQSITVSGDNEYFYDTDGVLFDKDGTLLQYTLGSTAAAYSVTNGVTAIAHGAFRDAQNLKTLVIAESVTEIGYYAFADSPLLSSVILNNSECIIGMGILNNTAWYDAQPDGVLYLSGAALGVKNASGVTTVRGGTVSIAAYALESVCAPEITLPSSVMIIGYGAFRGNAKLTSASLGSGIEYIGDYCFEDCAVLSDVSVLSESTFFGTDVFDGVSAALKITCGTATSAYFYAVSEKIPVIITAIALSKPQPSVTFVSAAYACISWKPVSRAEFYIVYVDGVKTETVTCCAYTISDLDPKTHHSFYIVAENGSGESAASDTVDFTTSSYIIGDADGDGAVTIADALMIFKHVAGVSELNADMLSRSDTDGDGDTDIADALTVFKHVAGLI